MNGIRDLIKILQGLSLDSDSVKSFHSRPTLCDPIDGSPPGSSIPGNLQARILEWVAISFSISSKLLLLLLRRFSLVRLCVTP